MLSASSLIYKTSKLHSSCFLLALSHSINTCFFSHSSQIHKPCSFSSIQQTRPSNVLRLSHPFEFCFPVVVRKTSDPQAASSLSQVRKHSSNCFICKILFSGFKFGFLFCLGV
ncbi:unnamed protein product [Rhodiola kirilowii]